MAIAASISPDVVAISSFSTSLESSVSWPNDTKLLIFTAITLVICPTKKILGIVSILSAKLIAVR